MDGFYYKDYWIESDEAGYYHIGFIEFPSVDEAMDWVDAKESYEAKRRPVMHTYLFFYVDKATDQSYQARIQAENYKEAEKILYQDYDVYHIAGYDVLD